MDPHSNLTANETLFVFSFIALFRVNALIMQCTMKADALH